MKRYSQLLSTLLILAVACSFSFTKASVRVVEATACQVYIPNAFSPNNDGRNDEFKPLAGSECAISEYELNIFDRWGNLVFNATSPEDGWDGEIAGEPAASAAYIYVLKYAITSPDGLLDREILTGDLSLLR